MSSSKFVAPELASMEIKGMTRHSFMMRSAVAAGSVYGLSTVGRSSAGRSLREAAATSTIELRAHARVPGGRLLRRGAQEHQRTRSGGHGDREDAARPKWSVLGAAGAIVQVEARHAAAIRFLRRRPIADGAFDKPLDKQAVLKAAMPLITS